MATFLQIDAATPEHLLKQVFALQHQCFSPCWSDEQVTKHIQHSRSKSFALIDSQTNNGKPVLVGYVFYQCLFDCAELLQIAIHSDYRNKGFAANLVDASLPYLNQLTIENIQLEVRESNTHAIKLYQSLGFTLDGVRKNYYPAIEVDGTPPKGREHAHLFSKVCTVSNSNSNTGDSK